MKQTLRAKTTKKTVIYALAVITALSLVFLQMPIFSSAQKARAAAATEVSEQVEKSGSVDVKFSFDHAFVNYDGQVIAPPASKVTLPAGSDLVFTAEADSGYEVDTVEAKIGGSWTTLSPNGNEYEISADALLDGKVSVNVSAISLPEEEAVEEEAVEEEAAEAEAAEESAEPADSKEAAKDSDENKDAEAADTDKKDESAGEPEGDKAEGQDESADASSASADASADAADGQKPEAGEKEAKREGKRNEESQFTYSDSSVSIKAVLSDPAALPEGVKFVVTPVYSGTQGYNYNAYMEALNNGSDMEYTDENTLLYDIAFMVPKLDDEGNAIAGEYVEAQLDDGVVSISIDFKKDQLSDTDAEEVEVKHLPLKDSVADKVDSTAEATNIYSSDVKVEDVGALKADVSKDEVSFELSSLSLIAVTTVWNTQTTANTMTDYSLHNILSNYTMFVDGDVNRANHMVGPVAVSGDVKQLGTIGTGGAVSRYAQSVYIRGEAHTGNIMSTGQPVYLGTVNISKLNNWYGYDTNSSSPLLYTNEYIDFDAAFASINNQVSSLTDSVTWENGNDYLLWESWTGGLPILNLEAGRNYRFEDISQFYPWNTNRINNATSAEADTLILLEAGGTVTLPQITTGFSSNEVGNGTSIVFIIPNATKVVLPSTDWIGHVIAPNAEITQEGGNFNGCLVGKSIDVVGEGHLWGYNGSVFSPAISGLKVSKSLVGSDGAEAAFDGKTFQAMLTGEGDAPMPNGAANGTKTIVLDSTDAKGFGDITFPYQQNRSSDAYEYTITETNTGLAGITYDATVYHVKATVTYSTNNGNGVTNVTWTYYKDGEEEQAYPDAGVVFTNTKQDEAVEAAIEATKVYTGGSFSDMNFGFELKDANGAVIQRKWNDANGHIAFDAITYTQEGTYTYTLSEIPDANNTWVEYDSSTKNVTVVVGRDSQGKLAATVSYDGKAASDGGAAVFTNKYKAETSIVLTARKTINQKTPAEGAPSFTFKLTGTGISDDEALTATSGEGGMVQFPEIKYTHAGTYTYTIQEVNDNKGGYTYSTKQATVTVTVTDDHHGNLTATVDHSQANPVFDNSYSATGSASLAAKKTYEGAPLTEGLFTFKLEGDGNVSQTKANDKDGNVAFDAITYTEPGEYNYTITEVAGATSGSGRVTYDTKTVHVKVTATDNGSGTLDTTVAYTVGEGEDATTSSDAPVFENRFEATGSIVLEANKAVEGKSGTDMTQFAFELLDESGQNVLQKVHCDSDGHVAFAQIDYTAAGTYKYKIREFVPSDVATSENGKRIKEGLEYDTHVADVTVDVTVDANDPGKLVAVPQYGGSTDAGNLPYFVNTYSSKTSLTLGGTKTMAGREFKQGDKFTFTISASGEGALPAPTPKESSVSIEPSSGSSASFSFGEIEYTQDDAGKTYVYTIAETYPSNGNGMTIDQSSHKVTVSVVDDGKGNLTASADYSPREFKFTNTYDAKGSASISGTKTIENASPAGYRFKLASSDGTYEETVTSDANGKFAFSAIDYTLDMLTKATDAGFKYDEFTYTVTELNDGKAGVTYAGPQTVKVRVEDNGTGTLKVTYGEAGDSLTFENTYKAEGEANLFAVKALTENTSGKARAFAEGDFSFQLIGPDGKVIETKAVGADGTAAFAPIKYNVGQLALQPSGDRAADFTYTIKEVIPENHALVNGVPTKDGVSYDTNAYAVTVHVVDNGSGSLAITYNGATQYAGATFANTYDAKGSVQIPVSKAMSGRAFNGEEEYSFAIEATGENASRTPMPGNPQVSIKPASGEQSATVLGTIDYKLSDLTQTNADGAACDTFTYKVREVVPEGAEQVSEGVWVKDGVTYDASEKNVTVQVVDAGNGTLATSVTQGSDEVAFTNAYDANTSLALKASKTVDGGAPGENASFSFVIAGGNLASPVTASSNAQGDIEFTLDYGLEDAGKTYTYTMYEAVPGVEHSAIEGDTYRIGGVVYDTREKTFKVSITDNGDGTLSAVATPSADDAVATFANKTYNAEGEIVFTAQKTLNGAVPSEGKFSFELLDADGNVLDTKANGADGIVTFDKVVYTLGDAGNTYTYKIREVLPDGADEASKYTVNGWTYDPSVQEVHVTVADEGNDGTLTVTSDKQGVTAQFANAYAAEAEVAIGGDKAMTGRAFQAGDEITFTIAADEGTTAKLPQPASVTIEPTSGSSAEFAFAPISYTLDDLKQVRDGRAYDEFDYVVSESATLGGVTNDAGATENSHKVHVAVWDTGNGYLDYKVTCTDGSDGKLAFANGYDATGSVQLKAHKSIGSYGNVRGIKAGDDFTFVLKDSAGNELDRKACGVDGYVTFDPISYKLSDRGKEFEYTISEVKGDVNGVTYTDEVQNVVVTVTDDGAGTLATDVAYSGTTIAGLQEGEVAAEFTNSYDAKGDVMLRGSKSIVGRDFQQGDRVVFTLEPVLESLSSTGEVPMPSTTEIVIEPTDGTSADFAFPSITFTSKDAGKTYLYNLKETATMGDGVSNDENTHLIKVEVGEDDGSGTLNVVVTCSDVSVASFTNTYTTSGSIALEVAKAYTRGGEASALAGGEFTFELVDVAKDEVIATATNGADGKVAFEALEYGQADAGKSFDYIIREVRDAHANADNGYAYNGLKYDAKELPVTVTVGADDGSGHLDVTAAYDGDTTFTNEYTAQGEATIQGSKGLSSRTLEANQFTFKLLDSEGVELQTAKNDTLGSFAFSPIKYSLADAGKTYTYKVVEVNTALAGYGYDTHEETVTVTVPADDNTGVLVPVVTYDSDGLAFSNTYEATGEITLSASKELAGRDLADGQFSFELKEVVGNEQNLLQTKQNAGGDVVFDTIEYDAPGVHNYLISEVKANAAGYTYDEDIASVTVTVTDNGDGTLQATKAITGEVPTFKNSYNAETSLVLEGSKTLTGRDFREGDSFSFTLVPQGDAPASSEPTKTILPESGNAATFGFGKIDYKISDLTQKDENGVAFDDFVYTVIETASVGGVQNDSQKTVKVHVVDNGDGTLTATPSYYDGDEAVESLAFGNTYTASGELALAGTKTLTGREFQAGDVFTFKLEGSEGAPMPMGVDAQTGEAVVNDTVTVAPTAGTSVDFGFGPIRYTLEDAGHEYTYTITESGDVKGVVNDTARTIVVNVADNHDGSLAITKTYFNGADEVGALTFANKYVPTGKAKFKVMKTLNGRTLHESEFSFELREGNKLLGTVENSGGGQAEFAEITYELKDVGTHNYSIKETKGNLGGVTYSEQVHNFSTKVTDNGSGELLVEYVGYDPEAGVEFVNEYKAEGEVSLTAKKTMADGSKPEAGTYHFRLVQIGPKADGSADVVVQEDATNGEGGVVSFDPVSFDKPETREYKIVEVVPTNRTDIGGAVVSGDVIYDQTIRTAKIVATDNGKGGFSFDVTYDNGEQQAFENGKVDATTFALGATKTMENRAFQEGDSFEFAVSGEVVSTRVEGAAQPEVPMPKKGNDEVTTVTVSPEPGKTSAPVEFGDVTFTADDFGNTYRYTIAETTMELDANGVGVKSSAAHHVDVTVVADGYGKLGVQAVYDDDPDAEGMTIVNEYYAKGEAVLFAKKTLDGRALKANEFSFKLSGDRLASELYAQAGEDGVAEFAPIHFTQEDVGKDFHYTISEVEGTLPGVTYVTTPQEVTVHVEDDGDGTLAITYNGKDTFAGAPFTNTYRAASTTASINVQKIFSGRDWTGNDTFSFDLAGVGDAPMPGTTHVDVTKDTPNYMASFGTITFETAGDYEYTITEALPAQADGKNPYEGVTYDTEQHKVTVKVTDNLDGTMSANVTYGGGRVDAEAFTNTYNAASTSASINVRKAFSGRDWATDDEFTFQLEAGAVDEGEQLAPLPEKRTVTVTKDTPNYTAAFDAVEYQAAGEYVYLVKEVKEGDATTVDGITYDLSAHAVTVKVEDDGKGNLVPTVMYADGAEGVEAVTITNTYSTTGTSAQLEAKKELAGEDATLVPGAYTFNLVNYDENTPAVNKTATNGDKGAVVFEPITYEAKGDYYYKITEVVDENAVSLGDGTYEYNGVVYDPSVYVAKVSVEDNGKGALTSSVVYYKDGESAEGAEAAAYTAPPTFTNKRMSHANLKFNKYHFGGSGTFQFELIASDEQGNPRAGEAKEYGAADKILDNGTDAFKATVENGDYVNNGAAAIAFPEISYPEAGTYHYLVQERESSDANMAADEAKYIVHVTIDANGAAKVACDLLYGGYNYGPTDDLSFYNNSVVKLGFASLSAQSYNSLGERVSVYPKAQKYLNGSTAQLIGGDFQFELIDEATGKVIATATNDENGVVAFYDENVDPGLVYDEPGTFRYIIREVAGDDAGVTYDTSEVSLTVTVEQTEEGLVATTVYNGPGGAEPAFYNVKEGMDVTVQKVSRSGGEGLEGSTYALWMVGESGDVLIQEAVSDANGYITFKDVNLVKGQKYYFKEVAAPSGHTVDPYRTAYFSLNEDGTALVLSEKTAADGWHSATENIEADNGTSEAN